MKGCEALWASNRHRRLLVLITNKLIPNTPPRSTPDINELISSSKKILWEKYEEPIYMYMPLKLLQNPVGKIRRKRHSIYDHCSKQKFLTNLEAMHIFNMSCISSSKKTPWEKIEDMTYILVLILPH